MITRIKSTDAYKKTVLEPIFSDSSDIDDLNDILINQDKAIHSLELGLSIAKDGYNIYLSGSSSSRRKLLLESLLEKHSKNKSIPNDLCYINNFNKDNIYEPVLLSLKAGEGHKFKVLLEEFSKNTKDALKEYFASDKYRNELSLLDEEYYNQFLNLMNEYTDIAKSKNFLLYSDNGNIIAVMCDKYGRALSEKKLNKYALKHNEEYTSSMQDINNVLSDLFRKDALISKEKEEKLIEFDKESARAIVNEHLKTLKYILDDELLDDKTINKIETFFNGIEEYILDNLNLFKELSPEQLTNQEAVIDEDTLFEEYFKVTSINLLVDNKDLKTAPVIFSKNIKEEFDLFGGVMYEMDKKSYNTDTDFLKIKAGDFVKANGGYLVLDIKELLINDLWDDLKKCLINKEVEFIGKSSPNLILSDSLKPEAIPVDVKVILVGSLDVYFALFEEDSDFRDLFEIHSKFDYTTDRTPENELLYAKLLKAFCTENNLNILSYDAICKLIEYSSKITEHNDKLTLEYASIYKILIEADNLSKLRESDCIEVEDVQFAIKDKVSRVNYSKKHKKDSIINDNVILSVHDSKVGEINALCVLDYYEYKIGDVSKITANTYKTKKYTILSSDKESNMSGCLHDKALNIVLGYLGETFGQDKEFPYSINITFEQLYGGIDGDSATLAKTCAILSNLANVPIKQCYGITGSMNQKGKVQTIGGVNEKIEGFYDLCKIKNLESGGGVIIPRSNINNLMLSDDIVSSIEDGTFTIYAVDTIKDAIEILTEYSFDDIVSKIKSKY